MIRRTEKVAKLDAYREIVGGMILLRNFVY